MKRKVMAILLSAIICVGAGCATRIGFEYLPERTYYTAFEKIADVEVRRISRVRKRRMGVHFLTMELRSIDVRAMVSEELGDDPNHYVSNLQITTDANHAPLLLVYLGLYLPRVTVEFEVIEVARR